MNNSFWGALLRLGPAALTLSIITALALGGVLWAFTHSAAEPGTTVKVLFGLTEYTKSAARPQPNTPPAPLSSGLLSRVAPDQGSSEKPPLSLELFHNVEKGGLPALSSVLQQRLSVRELSPIETGVTLKDAPVGTKFYVSYFWLRSITSPNPHTATENAHIFKEASPLFSYEAFYTPSDGKRLLVFCTEVEAVAARALDGKAPVKFLASPIPWGAATSAILVPIERIVSTRGRELEIGGGDRIGAVDVTLR